MQGRLLPKYKGNYQAHPKGYWQEEFTIAKQLGLDCVEFILDFEDYSENPLMRFDGLLEICQVVRKTGVSVRSICADYFMVSPFHQANNEHANISVDVLKYLITIAPLLGCRDIVIPCVDNASLKSSKDVDRFIEMLRPLLGLCHQNNVNLAIEADLAPNDLLALIRKFDSPNITVNYDIGNSASLGFDPKEEFDAYGKYISNVHIKDRLRNGPPVELGKGDAQFDVVFNALKEMNYQGLIIMQAWRDDEGVAIFKKQMDWINPFIHALNGTNQYD